MTTLSLTVTEDGLRLPRRLFKHAGEVEVIERDDYLLIKPKAAEREASRAQAIAALREAGLIITPEWPAPPAVSPEERARLAQKISVGQPLSEIIIADRADRA
jgi:hypothetical protein